MSICRTWRDCKGFCEPRLSLVEESSSGHKLWAKALEPHSWTGGPWPAASQSWVAPQCELHLFNPQQLS